MHIKGRLFAGLTLSFIAITIVGTIFHESGHYLVARCLGYRSYLHANYTWTEEVANDADSFYITLGGPLQTILVGTFGFILVMMGRRSYLSAEKLTIVQWGKVFLTLFWLRECVNFITWLVGYFVTGEIATQSDEIRIAFYFGLPAGSILGLCALVAAVLSGILFFYIIPRSLRLTFLSAALVGGITGYYLWILLPGKF